MTDAERGSGRLLRRDVAAAVAFAILWILPIASSAALGYPPAFLPTFLRDQYSISCLFSSRPTAFDVYGIQVRRQGKPAWEAFEESELFGLEPFGHRNRFDRFMARWGVHRKEARQELAEWIAAEDRRRDDRRPPIIGVRFLVVTFDPVRAPPPEGPWKKPSFRPGPHHRPRVISSHLVEATP